LFAIDQSRQPDRTNDEVAGLIEGTGRGELRAVIDRTLPFADAADANRFMKTGKAFGASSRTPKTGGARWFAGGWGV
jgi:NADPH:quinone reductase-like Zn-dependent oxidoreductase